MSFILLHLLCGAVLCCAVQVMATFDGALEQLRAVSLRLLRLAPAASMRPERLHLLRHRLIEGLIVL
jgi:hypothetical protein